jgi:hypothetical protein
MHHFLRYRPDGKSSELEPLAVPLPDAQRISGQSRTSLYRANARGDLIFIKAGSKTLVDYESLKSLIQSLPRFIGKTGQKAA